MQDYRTIVEIAVAQLTNEGRLAPTSDPEQSEQKSLITRRTAWLIYQHDPRVGLLRKESGAQFMGMSTDTILDRSDGTWSDIASSHQVDTNLYQALGTWQPNDTPSSDPDWLGRWVEPTEALAETVPDDGTGGTGGDTTHVDTAVILTAIAGLTLKVDALAQQLATQTSHFTVFNQLVRIHPDAPAHALAAPPAAAFQFPGIPLPADVSLADLLKAIQTIASVIAAIQKLFGPHAEAA